MHRRLILAVIFVCTLSVHAYGHPTCNLWGREPHRVPLWNALLNFDYHTYRGYWYELMTFMRALRESPRSIAKFPMGRVGFLDAWTVLRVLDLPLTVNTTDPQGLSEGERLRQKILSIEEDNVELDALYYDVTIKLRNEQRALRHRVRTLSFSFLAEGSQTQEGDLQHTWVALDAPLPEELRQRWRDPAMMYRYVKQIQDPQAVRLIDELEASLPIRIAVTSPAIVSSHLNSLHNLFRWIVPLALPLRIRQGQREVMGTFLNLEQTGARRTRDPLRLRFRTNFHDPDCKDEKAYHYSPEARTEYAERWARYWELNEKCTSTIEVEFTKEPIELELLR